MKLVFDLLPVDFLSRRGVDYFYQVLVLELQGHVSVRSVLCLVPLYVGVGAIEHETARHHVFRLEAAPDRLADSVIARDIRHGSAGIGHAAMPEAAAEEAPVARVGLVQDAAVLVTPVPGEDPSRPEQLAE